MPSLLRSRSILPKVARHLARNPQQLQRLVHSKWLVWRTLRPAAQIQLPAPLYVTLTSYPARFGTLATTLKCLLMQSAAPRAVRLWIAEADLPKVPRSVLALKPYGLQIRTCSDLRSYKKIIPALREEPNAFYVTADDDCYYGATWLERMVRAWTPYSREVICHRAHRIRVSPEGLPLPYREWELELGNESAHPGNFMTGVGGVLYPPGCFAAEVTNEALFQQICRGCDDVWLWWMLRRNGYWVRKIGGTWMPIHWPESQASSLYAANVLDDGNDVAVRAMVQQFGFPDQTETRAVAAA